MRPNLIQHIFISSLPEGNRGLFIEINVRKSKWLSFGTYHPLDLYFDSIGCAIDAYSGVYDKIIFTGNFNAMSDEGFS